MPTFETPMPIAATVELSVGDIRVVASDRGETVVKVSPSDASQELDVRAAEQTLVEYSAGRLLVKAPRQRALGLFGKAASVDVTIELPTGSQLQASASVAALRCTGRLGDCRVKTSAGGLEVEDTGILELSTGIGAVVVDRVFGAADLSTGSGKIRVRSVEGSAVIKNSNGDIWIGEVSGELRLKTANGELSVDRAHAGVTAATANGDIRIGELTRGSVEVKTGSGRIELGIRAGSAARLDVHTAFGRVHNELDTAASPQPSDETLQVQARTSCGDIVIRRSVPVESTLEKEQ